MVDAEEKATDKRQWRETSYRPVAIKTITVKEIEELRGNFAKSYKCSLSCISRRFEPVSDSNDIDRNDCIMLIYTITEIVNGRGRSRDIWSSKIPVPEEIKHKLQSEKEIARAQASRRAAEIRRAAQATGNTPQAETASTE
jgi:hypothetical protein